MLLLLLNILCQQLINTEMTITLQAEFPQHRAAVSGDKFGFRFSED